MTQKEIREPCRLPGCNKWHKLQIYLEHNLDEKLHAVLEESQYPTMRPFVTHILRNFLNEVDDSLDAMITPPKKRIRVNYSDLDEASVMDLRKFARKQGIQATRKADILEALRQHSGVVIIRD